MAGTQRETGKLNQQQLTPQTFWPQATALYSDDQVRELCLQAQDKQGMNVNLLLLMMWLQQQQAPLTLTDYDELRMAVNQFNESFTAPLRAQRRHLSEQPQLDEKSRQQLKKHLLAAELILEAEEQALLIDLYHRLPAGNAGIIRWQDLFNSD